MATPVHLDTNNFDSILAGADKPVLVDFWAPWCGPCRMLAPVLETIASEMSDQLIVGKLNTDENQKIGARFNIMSIPTLILFRNGKPVTQVVGFMQKEHLLRQLKPHLGATAGA